MMNIVLSNGYCAIVDDDDYKLLSKYHWTFHPSGYAYRHERHAGKQVKIYMHHQIYGIKTRIDHKDGNGLNNQKYNLRPCTQQQNCCNQRMQTRPKSSRFKGVCWDKNKNKWLASIQVNCKQYFIGRFISEKEAALAYNQAAFKLHGEYARINSM